MFIDYFPKEQNIRLFCIADNDIQSGEYTYSMIKECVFKAIKSIQQVKNKKIRESKFFMYFGDFGGYYCFGFDDKYIISDIFYETFSLSFGTDFETEGVSRPACPLAITHKYHQGMVIEFDESMATAYPDEKHTQYGLEMIYGVLYPEILKKIMHKNF